MSLMWEDRYSRRADLIQGSAIRELLKITEKPEFISFGGGMPAPEVFPVKAVEEASERVLAEHGPAALQYSTTEGYRPLRRWIATYLSRDGLRLDENNILVTSGSQQALDLIGKLFVDANDRIVVESPTYLATLQCWRPYGATFASVPSDQDGMVTDELAPILRPSAKLIYCVPNFQNPRGVTISAPRRRELVAVAREFDVPIVEDDPYGSLRFEGEPLPSLMCIDAAQRRDDQAYDGNVIGLGSFSKVLAPGLRVGWIAAPPRVIEKLTLVKQATDLHTSTFTQMVVHDIVSRGIMERHIGVIVDEYRRRRDVMLAALTEMFPQGTTWTHRQGGMFLWVTLPANVDASKVLELALEQKVAFVPGTPFHADGAGRNTMRLNFSNATPDRIREGIRRLAAAIAEVLNPVSG